jgi:hypothetical protein
MFAVGIDRNSGHEFHHHKRDAVRGCASV